MEPLLQQLNQIPEIAELVRRVEEGGCPAAVTGLQPVQRACVGAAVSWAAKRPAVFLCGDEREARQLAGDMETLLGEKPVVLLSREWELRPGAVASREWERNRLAALDLLPPKYRTVIYLYYYEGYSAREIAALLGEKPATVFTRLDRGRQKLRTYLEQEELT